MGKRLCASCWRDVPLNDEEYVDPRTEYGPGICATCQTFSPQLRQGLHWVKGHIAMWWLKEHREDICKVLFAEIGESEATHD